MMSRSQVASLVASTYGSGAYGSSTFGSLDRGTVNLFTIVTSPDAGCAKMTPGSAPTLRRAVAENSSSIRLDFTKAADPVDHYVLEYGLAAGKYTWGVSAINSSSTTYLVQSLTPNSVYYFRLSGANGCAIGAWSNEISARTRYGSALTTSIPEREIPTNVVLPLPGPEPTTMPRVSTPIQNHSSIPIPTNHPFPWLPIAGVILITLIVGAIGIRRFLR